MTAETLSGAQVAKRLGVDRRAVATAGRPAPLVPEPLMLPHEVAAMFRVDSKTVTRWARAGKLRPIFTLGGHRRYRVSEVSEHLARCGGSLSDAADDAVLAADVEALISAGEP